jgi:phage/plasmid-like protein (TIGR03299 family)
MAHNIEKNDALAFTGSRQRIWHGIGEQIPEGLSAQEAFEKIGLGWKTKLRPVFCLSNDLEMVPCDGHMMHVRSDNGLQLGMVTDGYRPFENQDLARFADLLAGEDAAVTVSTAGSLFNCRRVFALVKLPEVIRATSEDISELYILCSNGHGGFASFSVYPTSVRVVCANTLRMSERDAGKGISFRHTGDFSEKVKMARLVLGTAKQETQRFQEQVNALVGCNLSVGQAREFMNQAWEIAFGKLDNVRREDLPKMLAKRDVMVEEWLGMMENERNSMPGIKGTLWSALNAVTEYHDHERGRFKPESEARLHSNLFGVSALAKRRTLRAALQLV